MSSLSPSLSTSDDASRHQRLLPAFASLDLAHDVTMTYLSDLTARHGMHLHIFFDGTNIGGSGTRRLCRHGTLPSPDGNDK